jgi:hypothetical protein
MVSSTINGTMYTIIADKYLKPHTPYNGLFIQQILLLLSTG